MSHVPYRLRHAALDQKIVILLPSVKTMESTVSFPEHQHSFHFFFAFR